MWFSHHTFIVMMFHPVHASPRKH